MMDPNAHDGVDYDEPLAEGIEDMQIAVGIDNGTDGISDIENPAANLDEWVGNVATETLPLFGVGLIRAIRISLVARSTGKLTGAAVSNSPGAEDHPPGPLDEYRRRLLTSIVEIRNLGGSP